MALEIKYWVLKPKSKRRYDSFATASRAAIRTFAKYIEPTDPKLAYELNNWAEKEMKAEGKCVLS